MGNKIGICSECGKENRLIRGLCATSCYSRLLRNKKIDRLAIKTMPAFLTKEQHEVLMGLLLGDGCLYKFTVNSNPILSVCRQALDVDYLKYQQSLFNDFCLNGIKYYQTYDERTNKTYDGCKFVSRNCQVFNIYYNEWYVDGYKVVPKNLILNELICAIWFCDDGSIYNDDRGRLHIKLSTHGFTENDNIWLANYLSSILKEHFSIAHDHGLAFIIGADAAAKSYIKYIEKFIPQSMSRKITWCKDNFLMERSRPQLLNRREEDLNEKEISILNVLYKNNNISSIEICRKINWGNGIKLPSAYGRYLNKFLDKNWIEPIKIVISGKSNTKYIITNVGKKILNEAISFNTSNEKR